MSLIKAVIQDENGNSRGEAFGFSGAILPSMKDTRYSCLRFIDLYGDTVFNHLQLPFLVEDLHLRLNELEKSEQVAAVRRIEELALGSLKHPHQYLKFIGD